MGKLILASTNFGGPNAIPVTPEALAVMLDRSGDPAEVVKRGVAVACAPGFPEQHPEIVQELVAYRFTNPVPPAAYQAQLAIGLGLLAPDAAFEGKLGAVKVPTLILFGDTRPGRPARQRRSAPPRDPARPGRHPAGRRAHLPDRGAGAGQPGGLELSCRVMAMPRYAQIVATGRCVPDRVMTNAEFEPLVGKPVDQWLIEKVGIRERHVMADDQATSDLIVPAARQALGARRHCTPDDLDLIIVATDTPDYISPATASVVQAKLGASACRHV